VNVDFEEVLDALSRFDPHGCIRRDDRYQNNDVVASKHGCEVDDSPDMLFSIGLAEAEASRQVLPDYVAVQLLGGNAVRLQASKESVTEGCFTSSTKPCEPDGQAHSGAIDK
jgi:hypothetical protein